MRLHFISATAALTGCALLLMLTARAEPPKVKPDGDLPISGKANPNLASFDRVMEKVVRAHHVPGAALAVARNGRLVYARGYGYADLDKKEPVAPNALFRIASVTKPFTAAAVLQLVERGKLHLNDKVFHVLELKAPTSDDPNVKFDQRWKNVTILDLLQHRGGWDSDKSFDPVFRSPAICKEMKVTPPTDQEAIIHYMLRRPLDFDPGERYVYSNFGYCLLGRVIEKVSESGYEGYVKKKILAPLGIERMRLGRTLPDERGRGEVKYYADGEGVAVMGPHLGKPVPWPYGAWCIESMDSHGGWIASAEDLVRFAAAFNRPKQCKILDAKSIQTMFARPPGAAGENKKGKPADSWYGCGWSVRPVGDGKENTWHNGALDGTSTLLVRRSDGLTWAALFNSREAVKGQEPADAIDGLLHEAADAVKHWPGE
jgi:CubicO group peptidase (beta-lactamase class C family)